MPTADRRCRINANLNRSRKKPNMYIDQSYDPNAPLANDPAARQELIRDQERAQQLFELAFPGKQQPKPPKKVSPLLPRSVTLGEMLKVCSDLQDPVGIWTATMNDLPRSVQTRLVHYLNQLPARYRSFVVAVMTQQPRRPPKVLHLWPPKLPHLARGDLMR